MEIEMKDKPDFHAAIIEAAMVRLAHRISLTTLSIALIIELSSEFLPRGELYVFAAGGALGIARGWLVAWAWVVMSNS